MMQNEQITRLVKWLSNKDAIVIDTQDESLSEHDKRFHPGGYKEGDACKLRETQGKKDDVDSFGGKPPKTVDPWYVGGAEFDTDEDGEEGPEENDGRLYGGKQPLHKPRKWYPKKDRKAIKDYLSIIEKLQPTAPKDRHP